MSTIELGLDSDASPATNRLRPSTKRGRWLVAAVLLLAVALRFGAVFQNTPYTPATDALSFDTIATSLADGHGFGYSQAPPLTPKDRQPTALRAPLYPLTLAAVYAVAGDHSWTAGRLTNALIDSLVVALIGVIAAQLWSRRLAFVAMLIAAVDPTLILIGSSLQLEPLLLVMSLCAIAAALQHRRSPRGWLWPAVAGISIGLAVLDRETALVLVLPVAWLVWSADRGRRPLFSRSGLLAPVLVLVMSVVVVAPWTIRNAVRLHAFVPVSTSAGIGLAGTFNNTVISSHVNQGEWIPPWQDPAMGKILLDMKNPTEVKINNALTKASETVVKHNLAYPFRVAFWNTERLFGLDRGHYSVFLAQFEPTSHRLTRVAIYTDYLLYVLAVCGLFFSAARKTPRAIWAIPILGFLFIVFLLPAYIRYESLIEPFFIFLAAFPVAWLGERALARWTSYRRSRSITASRLA